MPADTPVRFVHRADASWLMGSQFRELEGVIDFWSCSGGIITMYRDEVRAVFEQFGPLREQANELQAPLDEEYKTSLSAILSPEQTQALEQQGGESRDRGGRRRGGFGGGGNPGGR